MSRFYRRLFAIVVFGTIITACTLSVQPLHKEDPYKSQGRVENVNCPPYFAPSFADEPDVPEFSKKELRNDTLFKRKLARYTEALQDYIDREHQQQRAAWRAYAKECHIL